MGQEAKVQYLAASKKKMEEEENQEEEDDDENMDFYDEPSYQEVPSNVGSMYRPEIPKQVVIEQKQPIKNGKPRPMSPLIEKTERDKLWKNG